jgi:hypothetical protein
MDQAAVNAEMQRWTEAEISRFQFREALFIRRGMSASAAETLADRLALRDQHRDERRVCIECEHLQRSGHCFAASQGRLVGIDTRYQPVIDQLARCEGFSWQKP